MTIPSSASDRIIVALDLERDEALRLADSLAGVVRWLKVGMTLFYREGPSIVHEIQQRGFDVFLDLKLHDIPHQVRGAAESVAALGVQMLTVHAGGGAEMVAAAARGAHEGAQKAGVPAPHILAVTVLTSMSDDTLRTVGIEKDSTEQVPLLARMALMNGADGIVCSPQEAGLMAGLVGDNGLIVTPGIRSSWADVGDQSRISTPAEALSRGATHLVIGRPITAIADPAEAVSRVVAEIEEAAR